MNKQSQWPLYSLLLGATLWGLTWWPLRAVGHLGIGGVYLSLLSASAALLLLIPFAWRQRGNWPAHVRGLALITLFGGYANLTYTVAMLNGNPLRVMMLFYLAPIWSLIGARLVLRERLDLLRVIAVLVAVVGAVMTLGGPQILRQAPAAIDLLAISAGFAYAMNNLAYRHAENLPDCSKNMACYVGALTWILLLWPIAGSAPSPAVTSYWWLAMLFGVLWYLPAVVFTQFGVSRLEATRSAVLITLELPVAAFSTWLIAGVRMTPLETLGGTLIFAAALLDSMPRTAGAGADAGPAANLGPSL
jgi:drug/metabolite transporter (DMT)-like permease